MKAMTVRLSHWFRNARLRFDTMSQRRDRTMWILSWTVPASVMGVVGFTGAWSPSLWSDELATWALTTVPLQDMLEVLRNTDASIGPYYLLMRVWIAVFGDSELAMRAPSILAMVGSTVLVVALGTRLSGRKVGVIAGMMFALIPSVSRYAHEARPYALAVFFAALSTYLLIRLLERPGIIWLACYGAAVLLLGLTHFVALMLLAAHGLAIFFQRRDLITRWLIPVAVALAILSPLMYLGQGQRRQISWIPELTGLRLLQTPAILTGSLLFGGMLLVLAFLALSWRVPTRMWTLWALIPTVGLALISLVVPMWLPRYLLFTLPAWVLLAVTAVSRQTTIRGAVLLVLVGLVVLNDHIQIRKPDGHSQDTRGIGALLNQHALPSDAIVYGRFDGDFTPRLAVARYTDPAHRPNDVLAKVAMMTQGNFQAVECDSASECLGEPDRIWVIRSGTKSDALAGIGQDRETLLREGYVTEQTWNLTGFTVALLIRKSIPVASGAVPKG